MKALLVIDMQAGSFTEDTPRLDDDEIVIRINNLSDLYRKSGNKVIFIQHDGSRENCFYPGTSDWEILSDLVTESSDIFINKTANDAFYNTDLHAYLQERKINDITITGCATDFCVEATIQSAIGKNYHVTIIRDGHTTADRPHAKAKTVIDHYNWVWENMSPTKGTLNLLTFDDYMLQKA